MTTKIKKSVVPHSQIKAIDGKIFENDFPVILFTYFKGNSINIKNFNNHYPNCKSSIREVSSFINIIKELQSKTIKELFDMKSRKQLHCHPINDEREIERINNVLLNGYNFSEKMVENFENCYYQFALKNGSRVIFVKVDQIFELLFIDNNHMIFTESSKNIKMKQTYSYPSCFGDDNMNEIRRELDIEIMIEMLVEDYKNGDYEDLDTFVKDLEDLLIENKDEELQSV